MSLISPITLRGITFPNRIVVSPMSQYRARDGFTNDWHLVHLGRFAMGGAGTVFCEATAVEERGRRTAGDLGIWKDEQIAGLRKITDFLKEEGSVPGIQLAHAGRKASERRPWHGETPIDDEDIRLREEYPWEAIGPSPLPYSDGWPTPSEMSLSDIQDVIQAFGDAARRSNDAGFDIIEVYAAHGFLLHQFYSPIANQRTDAYGGNLENRCRLLVEVAEALRRNWPEEKPLSFRLSATDWVDGGWEIEDTLYLAAKLKSAGVDMIDCSSGGIGGRERPRRMTIEQGFQIQFAQKVRQEIDIATTGVGFVWDAAYAQEIITTGKADFIALARELLADPNWPLKAAKELGLDTEYQLWKPEFGWWLDKRDKLNSKLKFRP